MSRRGQEDPECSVRAGQVFAAPARRGHRYLVVKQVRRPVDGGAYVIVVEVSAAGNPVRGDREGVDRAAQFYVRLTQAELGGPLVMPPWYLPHEAATGNSDATDAEESGR